ncbi:GPR1/FUN34/yaaH family-domain-containing protein [Scheffersomyces coipomensis]|uniref:GPR1/FUN34/yaaH family-domain-containing protein n=1 Tax=Scheffersomyces coipomensis TaxID=1788519 RepID=UPI00315D773E
MADNDSASITSIQSGPSLTRIKYSGDSDEFVIIGNQKYYRHELMLAFGGSLNPGVRPYPKHDFNTAPLGLVALSLTVFLLSLFNAHAMGIDIPNVFISLAVFYGGLVQFLAGAWLFVEGNTFAATALTSYGAIFIAYSSIFIEAFGIHQAYDETDQLPTAIGFLFLGTAIFTFLLLMATFKSTVAFISLFVLLLLTFLLLAIGNLMLSDSVIRAAGVIGVITALVGWYNSIAGVATKHNSYFTLTPIPLKTFKGGN